MNDLDMYVRKVREGEDMDVRGELFGLRFADENQVELFVEDDGLYHLKASFSRSWLEDLSIVTNIARGLLDLAMGGPSDGEIYAQVSRRSMSAEESKSLDDAIDTALSRPNHSPQEK